MEEYIIKPGQGYFFINKNKYPKGLYQILNNGSRIIIANQTGHTIARGDASQFKDADGNGFDSIDDLSEYLDTVFKSGGGDGDGVTIHSKGYGPRFITHGRTIGSWSDYPLSGNSKSAVKVPPPVPPPDHKDWDDVLELTGLGIGEGIYNESGAFGQINIPSGNRPIIEELNTLGIWVLNTTDHVREFLLRLYNGPQSANCMCILAVAPKDEWQLLSIPRLSFASNGLEDTDEISAIRISEFAANNSWGSWIAGEKIHFGDITLNPKGRATFLIGTDDGYSSNIYPENQNGYPTSGRSYLEVASRYGYGGKIAAYIVPDLLGSPGYLSVDDVKNMQKMGFVVGSHSKTHPANAGSDGLKLLGPYGYYLSTLLSNGLGAQNCAVIGASGTTLTTENSHGFGPNNPIQFYDTAPGGLEINTTYFVNIISTTTFSVSASRGGVPIGLSAWEGTANYRYAGSAPDDSAIYDDILAGINSLVSLGFASAKEHFALPQGAWDDAVASAVERFKFKTVRGVSSSTNGLGIPGVKNTGGGRFGSTFVTYGWINLPGSIQIDNAGTVEDTEISIKAYIDELIKIGGVGSSYSHGFSVTTAAKFDILCAYLREKEKEGLIDVLTLNEYADLNSTVI